MNLSQPHDLSQPINSDSIVARSARRDVSEAEIAEAVTLHKGGDVSVLFLLLWGFRWVEGTQLREGMQRCLPWSTIGREGMPPW